MQRDLVLLWNKKAEEILGYHINPGSDARRMAVFQIGIHDALNSIREQYERYCFFDPPKPQASAEAAVNAAAKELLLWAIEDLKKYKTKIEAEGGQFPIPNFVQGTLNDQIVAFHDAQMAIIPNNQQKERGRIIGEKAAEAITENRANDGHQNITILSNTPPDGSLWGHFRADYYIMGWKNKLMTDFGALVKPFSISSPVQVSKPIDSLDVNFAEIREVQSKGTYDYYSKLTSSGKQIIDTWRPVTQHVLWNKFAVEIINTQNPSYNAWKTARLLALIHTAMADGAISMFKDIYSYYRWRPITAINAMLGFAGWQSAFPTPRVPEYPSAFGIFGGACGKILTEEFTDQINISFENNSTYTSIAQAVKDNTESKLYLGWNFKSTFQPSMEMGREIGEYVYQHSFKPI